MPLSELTADPRPPAAAPASAPALLPPGPGPDDVQPTAHEWLDRFLTGLITVIPFLALGVVGWQLWNSLLHPSDLVVLAITYILTALGITVGFHRLFTHRSFKAVAPVRAALAVLGSAAIEGPIISWVADHRKHHAFSDQPGDPHSPHLHHGVLRGLLHAHVGWLFIHTERANRQRYAPDLLDDPVITFVDRTFFVWVLTGLAVPFGLGWAIGGSIDTALTGLLWGGAVRMLILHHVTYSINSLCHFFGRQRFETGDESRNLAWLAILSLGESWHHNHHAFPTSAHHGLRWYEVDVSSMVIRGLRRLGLAWDVVEVAPERQAAKLTA
ncbi:acyl-CoA desaturase [Baekduia soli]|uniref:Acyl-CoA desaturase n=1 Tax=Baekduia soli TaxID=496014 RepID=A0A5B8UBK4_9ACTN|nr:fatty acid desaturase [Baekduia soli]QEC50374.1 acyl-CoA desaturase [Baekduia soli]